MNLNRIGALAVFGIGLMVAVPGAIGQGLVAEPAPRNDLAAAFLNPLQVNQWIGMDNSKSIHGKLISFGETGVVTPRSGVAVKLAQKGKAVSRAVTDSDGMFHFTDIMPGSYSFVAESEYCFATFGIHVLPVGSGSPSSFEACVSAFSSVGATELIRDNWVPSDSVVADVAFDKDPLADKRIVSASPKVQLQDGDLIGQVSQAGQSMSDQDLSGNIAHVFRAGRSIAAAPVGRDGKFRIAALAEGVYDLAVVGEDGCAVIGFEAVGATPVAKLQRPTATKFISRQDVSNSLNIELADPTSVATGPEEVPPPAVADTGEFLDPGFGPSFMGGGFPGGGGFGGGGGGIGGGFGGGGAGFGGGGIGGLLGIAGLAVGIAAISEDDDFNPDQASLIVP